jgi:hypothetical protein
MGIDRLLQRHPLGPNDQHRRRTDLSLGALDDVLFL